MRIEGRDSSGIPFMPLHLAPEVARVIQRTIGPEWLPFADTVAGTTGRETKEELDTIRHQSPLMQFSKDQEMHGVDGEFKNPNANDTLIRLIRESYGLYAILSHLTPNGIGTASVFANES